MTTTACSGEEVNLYFLDIWHPAEVEKARSLLYPDVTPSMAAERYRIFGGIVRMVLVNRKATLNLNEFALMDVAKLQHLDLLGVESDLPHQLMHIRVSDKRFNTKSARDNKSVVWVKAMLEQPSMTHDHIIDSKNNSSNRASTTYTGCATCIVCFSHANTFVRLCDSPG